MTDALAKFKADSRATVRAAIKVLNQGDFRLMSLTVLLTPVNQTNARRYQKIASTVVVVVVVAFISATDQFPLFQ